MKLNTTVLTFIMAIGAANAKFYKCAEEKNPGLFDCQQMGIVDANRTSHPFGWPDHREELQTKNDKQCIEECWTRFIGEVVTYLGQCHSFAWRAGKKGDLPNCVMFNETIDGLMGVHPPNKSIDKDAFSSGWSDWVYNNVLCWKCDRK